MDTGGLEGDQRVDLEGMKLAGVTVEVKDDRVKWKQMVN